MKPIFKQDFAEGSYRFRPGRSARQAVAVVEQSLARGGTWIVDADLKGYFDSIPQKKLLACVREKVADGRVLALLEKFLKQGVMETGKGWEPTSQGTPQGAVISPLLANIYLDSLDHEMALRGRQMTPYADDFILLCQSETEAQEALAEVRQSVEAAGLTLQPEKTRIVNTAAGESFGVCLRLHFERGYKWPREEKEKFKETIRQRTVRHHGDALPKVITSVNQMIRASGKYFPEEVRNVPQKLEKWVRMRIHSILHQRDRRRGPGRGSDHHHYPNASLTAQGLISLRHRRGSRWSCPMKRLDAHAGNPNWKAGCGKSARPVWREGWRKPMRLPYPYPGPPAPAATLNVFRSAAAAWRSRAATRRRTWPTIRTSGIVAVADGTAAHTFTITNTGDAALNLYGAADVEISGENAAAFRVTIQAKSRSA